MEKSIAKKTIIVYVLNILKYTSKECPVTQTQICEYLNDIDISCDRKTVGRNIEYLRQIGYPIERINGKGVYIDRSKMSETKNKFII